MVGNKCDLERRRVVPTEEGQQLAASLGIPFLEASTKTNNSITEVRKEEKGALKLDQGLVFGNEWNVLNEGNM